MLKIDNVTSVSAEFLTIAYWYNICNTAWIVECFFEKAKHVFRNNIIIT